MPFEHESELTECVYIHFLWTNNLNSIRLLNKPLGVLAEIENGKQALASMPTRTLRASNRQLSFVVFTV